jgi:hypothetical protein
MNIAEIESALRELVDQRFDPGGFVFDFLRIYDAPKSTVTKLRQGQEADLLQSGDVLWKKKLWFRVAPKGKAAQTVDAMVADPVAAKQAPRFFLATDGREVYARDAKADLTLDVEFSKLNDSFDFFLPLAGIERYEGVAENPADIKATARLAKLYDAILEANPSWIKENRTHALNIFMTRMLFCFFAEGTSIFESGLFTHTLMTCSREDGSDLSQVLETLFLAMNADSKHRAGMPEFAKRFPYVNGGLFRDKALIPAFSKRARRLLKECGELSWSHINPDIFGSMIQAVVEPGMRGDMGMHYTSVPNIMKVLHPLFLLSLEEEFEAGRDSEVKLKKLLVRMQNIRVFDPACGSGNFLIIAYRELRKLENRIFERQRQIGQRSLPMTGVLLTQFFGIELADFAAETAKLSLWIAEYQMNEQFKAEFGSAPPALPLRDSGNIVHGNSLRLDWLKVCPLKDGTETYIVGNPPYLGSTNQDPDQKSDMERIFSPVTKAYKNLDYVAAWYLKAAEYGTHVNSQAAFVATNSICQGEQVQMLWPLIQARGAEIGFAHQSFKWRNNAAHVAGVTCVIVGIRRRSAVRKILYSGDLAAQVRNISPYLIDMDDTIIAKESGPINGLPKMDWGNKATDDGNLILSPEQRQDILRDFPQASKLMLRMYGSQEFIRGIERWCLWIADDQRKFAESIPPIKDRIEAVAKFRSESIAESTREYAKYSHRFRQIQNFGSDAVLVPKTFSEDRQYFTIGFSDGQTSIINDACFAIYDAEPYVMAILSSRLHAVWVSAVCGQLETRIRYSNTMGYHTFPVPQLSDEQRQELEDHAWSIIAAREAHPGKTIAWLYDPETMPDNILQAHRALDATLERICIGHLFKTDTERLEYLFKQYAAMKKKAKTGGSRDLAFKGRKA